MNEMPNKTDDLQEEETILNITSTQSSRALRIGNLVFTAFMSACSLGMLIYIWVTGDDPNNRVFANVLTAIGVWLPYLVELLSRRKFSNFLLTLFSIYVFLAAVVGSVFYVYDAWDPYDKIIHLWFGYLGSMAGLYLVCKMSNYKKLSAGFIAVICFSITMAAGAIWETLEFTADSLFGQTSQGYRLLLADGVTEVITVEDSMLDLLCNVGGGLIFLVHYFIHRKTQKNLLIGSMVEDFTRPLEKITFGKKKAAATQEQPTNTEPTDQP